MALKFKDRSLPMRNVLVVCAFLGCAAPPEMETQSGSPLTSVGRDLIAIMGAPDVPVSVHDEAESMLVSSESTEALGVLIGALDDQRVFDPIFISPAGNPATTVRHPITVGGRAEMLLGMMIGIKKGSKYGLPDWNKWWVNHKHMSLHEIRKEVEAAGYAP